MSDDTLHVQVAGGHGEPERLYIIGRPTGGRVAVTAMEFGTDRTDPARFEATPDELYRRFEQFQQQRRRVSESLYRVRQWVDGRG